MNSDFLNLMGIEDTQLLSREHLKNVSGGGEVHLTLDGDVVAGCTASCTNAEPVTCSGKNCVATDDVGCKSDLEHQDCIVA